MADLEMCVTGRTLLKVVAENPYSARWKNRGEATDGQKAR
jgi:hypothetical protein